MQARQLGIVAFAGMLGCRAVDAGDVVSESSGVGTSASPTGSSADSTGASGVTEGGSEPTETSAGEGESDGGSSDTGDPPPPLGDCDGDGACAFPETCNTCPEDCGSCDVDALPNQVARWVDIACAQPGDGSVDACAASPGMAGRFNDLQVALDALVPGDTLYVRPGDYFREGELFRVQGLGTADAPIVVTAAVPEDPPVLHSWDPAAPDDNARSHIAIGGYEQEISYVVLDNLRIDGGLHIHGDHTRVQNVECTHGWEVCDGNWSCIRLEGCTDCVAHHNYVHDVVDSTQHCNGENPPREAGLKEFGGVRVIWELNTIADVEQWGYDLHRSSTDSIVRYNLFRNAGADGAVRMNRTANMSAYGNVVLGGGTCVDFVPEDAGDGFANLIDHNTCLFTASGLYFNGYSPATVTNNVLGALGPSDADRVMIAAAPPEDGVPHVVDHNAYDASSQWVTVLYEDPYFASLEEWQAGTDYDDHSIAAPGGSCTFVDAPTDADDPDFDVTIAEGECAALGDRGQPVGACALTSCVGHDCSGCGF